MDSGDFYSTSKVGTKFLFTHKLTSDITLNYNMIYGHIIQEGIIYGGNTYSERASSQYIIASTPQTGTGVTVDVFGGDIFINFFDFLHVGI